MSSEPKRRSNRKRGLMAGALAVLAFCMVERRWFTTNDITTGQTPEYPDLPSRIYAADLTATRKAAVEAVAAIPRWRVMPGPDTEVVRAEVRTALFRFVDDVEVRFQALTAHPAPRTKVVIRSHSRVGKGDLGENARHIRALQDAMEARLPRADE